MFMRRRISRSLAKLAQAERSKNPGLEQKAYEDLFVLCRENGLDLPKLLRPSEEHRHAQVA